MDNFCVGIKNVKIDRCTIKNWTKLNPYTVFASPNNKFGKKTCFLMFEVYSSPIFDSTERKNFIHMQITYSEDANGQSDFRIKHSIRKWFFGKKSTNELTVFQFIDCIEKLANTLNLSNEFLMSMKVYKLEFGRTFKLSPSGKRILFNVFEHSGYKDRINRIKKGSIYLNGINSGIIIYDKLKELKDTETISRKTYSRLSKKKTLIRMELKIKKISGVEYAKKNFSTLQDIIYNWDLLLGFWKREMLKITYIDFLNEKEFKILSSNSKSNLQQYLILKGVEYLGFDNFLMLLDATVVNDKNRKYKLKKSILKIIKEMEGHKKNQTQNFVKSLIENSK